MSAPVLDPVSHCGSPFLNPDVTAKTDALAILHLKRDHQIPIVLRCLDSENEGYSEGKVTNTRFGSFPHSTLIGTTWGSQVRASIVDTGSRGRRKTNDQHHAQKRKRSKDDAKGNDPEEKNTWGTSPKVAVAASSGFVHILPPTPESWTTSLPHRTQVVYTPDYSYILQRLRVRPGSVIIEAGAGSGSFTHAAARAVFNGYPNCRQGEVVGLHGTISGKVWSFEFHEQRVDKLRLEIQEHGLDGVVEIVHRDVCHEGFLLDAGSLESAIAAKNTPNANAIFLDLPAPWIALKHLTRSPLLNPKQNKSTDDSSPTLPLVAVEDSDSLPADFDVKSGAVAANQSSLSPLSPYTTARICTFSPCIEQAQRTISTLRQLGWLDIDMVELAARRIEVRRERVGLHEEGLRGVNASPANVDEAIGRLIDVEGISKKFHDSEAEGAVVGHSNKGGSEVKKITKQQRLEDIRTALADRKLYKEGKLVHRAEPELKMHTSYLVFAVLPRDWTEHEEKRAREAWPIETSVGVANNGDTTKSVSRRQMKKAAKATTGSVEKMKTVPQENTSRDIDHKSK